MTDAAPRLSRQLGKEAYEAECRVYFIEAVGLGLVKIGYALNVRERFRSMLTTSPAPLSLLADVPGGPRLEAEMHEKFAAARAHGEWFRKTPEIEAAIAGADRHYASTNHNQTAPVRGAALQGYLEKMRRGEVVRPTRGPAKRPRAKADRYAWSPSDPFRSEP